MNHSWPALATCTVCLLCAAVQIYWGGQDQQGQFHPEYLSANGNLGMSLFFLGPYLCIHRIHHRVLNHIKEGINVSLPGRAPALSVWALCYLTQYL